jgi:hypothetical protein
MRRVVTSLVLTLSSWPWAHRPLAFRTLLFLTGRAIDEVA